MESKTRWAVEARIFNNGRIVTKIRTAENDEKSSCTETRSCDIWIDVFEAEAEAIKFAAEYNC